MRRSLVVAVVAGVGVAVAVAAMVYVVVAVPLYALAQTDPNGLDRPFIRNGFFRVALPAGGGVGVLVGVVVAVWGSGAAADCREVSRRSTSRRRCGSQ